MIRELSKFDALCSAHEGLGVDDLFDPMSIEFIATVLRRCASSTCPCAPRALRQAAVQVIAPLAAPARDADDRTLVDIVDDVMNALEAYGDIVEVMSESAGARRSVVHAAPPSFVVRKQTIFIVGAAPDRAIPIPAGLQPRMTFSGVSRRVRLAEAEVSTIRDELLAYGLHERTMNSWLKPPAFSSAADVLRAAKTTLSARPPTSGGLEGQLQIVAASPDPTYYPGRWRSPERRMSGTFVGRRPQAYGADLWCFVQLEDGELRRLVDLPADQGSEDRGCDAAWRLQAAIDAVNQAPQRYRVRDACVVDVFSPLPRWVQRRFEAVGERVPPMKCLLSYRFDAAELEEELAFLRNSLWMTGER